MIKAILTLLVIIGFGAFIMYNQKILRVVARSQKRSETLFYKYVGIRLKKLDQNLERNTSIKKGTFAYKVNNYFKNLIIDLGLSKDNVTPTGLLTFILSLALAIALAFTVFIGDYLLFIPAFGVFFYLILVIFRFFSLLNYEKKEANIMDAEDLIVMDVKGGVYNAIMKYRNSFHPEIKPYFEEFIDNIQNRGYGFAQAMHLLNDKLGYSFTNFAQKAVLYEEKADEDMEDIFSSIIEMNRKKRILRERNNHKFMDLMISFSVSALIITLYGFFSIWFDPFLKNFFLNVFFGKLILILDVVIVAAVLSYISSLKAKFI